MEPQSQYPVCLTIAGSDSGGGAGIQADLKTFAALGCYGTSVITALTAQNTLRIKSIFEVSPAFVEDQLDAVFEDFSVSSIKIGMLYDPGIVEVVANRLKSFQNIPIVLDPVMIAKSGDSLIRTECWDVLKELLFPLASVVTPNGYSVILFRRSRPQKRQLSIF
jgi:hydroxymethylpyrimidine/phosphomethylpyrimidine kinase